MTCEGSRGTSSSKIGWTQPYASDKKTRARHERNPGPSRLLCLEYFDRPRSVATALACWGTA